MHEILSTEQPCILCGTALLVVTIHRDDDTGQERVDRTPLPHTEAECLRLMRLYLEAWPPVQVRGL